MMFVGVDNIGLVNNIELINIIEEYLCQLLVNI